MVSISYCGCRRVQMAKIRVNDYLKHVDSKIGREFEKVDVRISNSRKSTIDHADYDSGSTWRSCDGDHVQGTNTVCNEVISMDVSTGFCRHGISNPESRISTNDASTNSLE